MAARQQKKSRPMPSIRLDDDPERGSDVTATRVSREEVKRSADESLREEGDFQTSKNSGKKIASKKADVASTAEAPPVKAKARAKVIRDQYNARIDVRMINAARHVMEIDGVSPQQFTERAFRTEFKRLGLDIDDPESYEG